MANTLRLMCVLAHPDDESLGMAGTLAKYADQGVEVYLVTATRGERGWPMDRGDYPGSQALGRLREAELRAAADTLGLREVSFLDYMDGDLDQAPPQEAIARIVAHLRRVRPHVVITFPPDGAYGHPDHIAISQFSSAAIVCAADAAYDGPDHLANGAEPYRVPKFYYKVWIAEEEELNKSLIGEIGIPVDGVQRRQVAWERWAVTTWIDTAAYWKTALQAVSCHKTQLQQYDGFLELPPEVHQRLWGSPQGFYRVYSMFNGGRQVERDLFEGLRERLSSTTSAGAINQRS
jgi:LmbE family N-acetylglucosaminyl deacetylase